MTAGYAERGQAARGPHAVSRISPRSSPGCLARRAQPATCDGVGQALDPPLKAALVVAHDVLGGFFAINGGAWPGDPGDPGAMHSFAPDSRAWEPMGLGYPAFLEWAMSDGLDGFYGGMRWDGWEHEVERVPPDRVLSIMPPLGFEAMPVAERDRRAVPARETWALN